jgi:hypothetical protein
MNGVGLWLVKSQTVGTGVSSVTVTSAFSADYENYRIIITGVAGSAGGGSISLQLNNSTGSTYFTGGLFGSFGSTTLNGYGPAAAVKWLDVWALDSTSQGGYADLYNPFSTARTMFTSSSVRTGVGNAWYMINGLDTAAVSNTGFTITPISGTMTGGTIRVYGFRN